MSDIQDDQELAALLQVAPRPGLERDPERVRMMELQYTQDRERAARAQTLARDAEWRDD